MRTPTRAALLRGASLGRELPLVVAAELVKAGRLPGRLVTANAADAREPQGESRRIRRALLDLIVGDLDDDLGPDADRVAVVGDRERPQPLGHLRELSVGEAL